MLDFEAVVLAGCNSYLEDQLVEGGRLSAGVLSPAWPHAWAWRQHWTRQTELADAKLAVDQELRYSMGTSEFLN